MLEQADQSARSQVGSTVLDADLRSGFARSACLSWVSGADLTRLAQLLLG